ncbi:hypothetical protein ES705_38526 [subsurface metagenome]
MFLMKIEINLKILRDILYSLLLIRQDLRGHRSLRIKIKNHKKY